MLKEGIKAPPFNLPDQNDKYHRLSDYKGKWVILYFYPKDMTPGCTTEACNFRDHFQSFDNLNTVILGISKDSIGRHTKFASKYSLPFPLLSDENDSVCEDYGVWQEKSMYGKKYMGINRSTFIIDPEGKIVKIYPKVNVKTHALEIMDDIRNMH